MQKKLLIFGGIFVGLLVLINQSLTLDSHAIVPEQTVQGAKIQPTDTITPTVIPTSTPIPTQGLSNNNYYINSSGNEIHSPAYDSTVPAGATAICRDGTYSFSQHRRGTCSHHGGVAKWL